MTVWPTKRCDNPKKHDPHTWDYGPWKRRCLGRKTSRKAS